jgi:plasmid maintenance system antidote protein VapI
MACIGRCSAEERRQGVSRRRLETVLRERSMSVTKAAEAFGCSTSKIYGVLNGFDRVTLDMALVLQERHGVSAAWLLALDKVRPLRDWKSDERG